MEYLKLSPKENYDASSAVDFANAINAVSFKRCKGKNVNGHWQIACLDKKAALKGFIICTSNKIRLEVFNLLTGENQ